MTIDFEETLFLSQMFSKVKPLNLVQQVLASSMSPIVVTDAGQVDNVYRILYANAAFCKQNGYELAELIGQSPKIFQGPKSNQATLAKLRDSLECTGYFRGISTNYRKDGSCYPIAWDISPIRGEDGNIEMFISNQRDLTDLVNKTKESKELNEQVRVLINDIASGKIDATEIKQSNHGILKTLQKNAKDLAAPEPPDKAPFDDDLFIELDADDPTEVHVANVKKPISASAFLEQERLTDDEIQSLLETLDDLEEEMECLESSGPDLEQILVIKRELTKLADQLFFIVEFTDTSLSLNDVVESMEFLSEDRITPLHIDILKSLVEEVEKWLVQLFVNKSTDNIYDGANSVSSAAKQLVSFIKPK